MNNTQNTTDKLTIVMWNINGLSGKQKYIQLMMEETKPDVVMFSETKMKRPVTPHIDIGAEEYEVVQLKSTAHGRGGMVVLTRSELQITTAEVIREEEGNNFIHAIILTNRKNETIVSWYNSPTTNRQYFYDKLKNTLNNRDVRCLAGDLNARHPRWCTAHDEQRRGQQLLKLVTGLAGIRLHAPEGPTFQAIKCRRTGELRSSTVDVAMGRGDITEIKRIDSHAAFCSDHYPVKFVLDVKIDRIHKPRRIAKTLLQSHALTNTVGMYYDVALRQINSTFDEILEGTGVEDTDKVTSNFESMEAEIKRPWINQANKRRRNAPAHWNQKFIKLLARKKLHYERMRWRPNRNNIRAYRAVFQECQRYERQLKLERERKNIQRIQADPHTEIALAIITQENRRKRQEALNKFTGKQMIPREYAMYMRSKLSDPDIEEVQIESFEVDIPETERRIERAIGKMARNKAAGQDQIHVEMMKANAAKMAHMLGKCWAVIGRTRTVPPQWLKGTITPLFKGKGEMMDPKNHRPLCILSHVRKVVEKAVVEQMEELIVTDKAQFGFQEGIQIEQAALRVAALLRKGIYYLLVLDLSKAYDTVLKAMLIEKLKKLLPVNLVKQLLVFITSVMAKVAGDITETPIPMRRGLTQGGTSSPPLFKVFINDLPEEIREMLRREFPTETLTDPAILVADDVIALSATLEQMQVIANACCRWAKTNGLQWNPEKSQLLRMILQLRMEQAEGSTIHETANTQGNDRLEVSLDNKTISPSEEADYLGMKINIRRGFVCKDPAVILAKGKGIVMMISKEKWFSLNLHPKQIANIYEKYVFSLLLYGSEILTDEERQPLERVDEELVRLFIKCLLKLKSTAMAAKHMKRIMVIFKIPTMTMVVECRCMARVDSWAKRSNCEKLKVAQHAKASMADIDCLHVNHPLRVAKSRIESGGTVAVLRTQQWDKIDEDSRSRNRTTSRHILTGRGGIRHKQETFPRFLTDSKVDPALKRAMMRWTIYNFPVRYKTNREEDDELKNITRSNEISDAEYHKLIESTRVIFNKEQECWGLWKLKSGYMQDVRSRLRTH